MPTKTITGKIVSQPIIQTNQYNALVVLLVETQEGSQELYYEQPLHSQFALVEQFVNTNFSKIALSAIGDMVECKVYDNSEILSFRNITRNRHF